MIGDWVLLSGPEGGSEGRSYEGSLGQVLVDGPG
jgi:hypothetical protein